MNTELDWEKLDIIRLFLLTQEKEFNEHIQDYGFAPLEAEALREDIMQLLWHKMDELV